MTSVAVKELFNVWLSAGTTSNEKQNAVLNFVKANSSLDFDEVELQRKVKYLELKFATKWKLCSGNRIYFEKKKTIYG